MKDIFFVTSVVSARILRELGRSPDETNDEAELLFARTGWNFISTHERLILNQASRCTACSTCNNNCPRVHRGNPRIFQGPMDLVLRIAPCAPDLQAGSEALKRFEACAACHGCVDICPQSIDIHALVDVMLAVLARSKQDFFAPNLLQQRQNATMHDPG